MSHGPGDTHLVALGEVVVDRVDHDAHDAAVGVGDGPGHTGGNAGRAGLVQVSLVKEDWWRVGRAGRAQARSCLEKPSFSFEGFPDVISPHNRPRLAHRNLGVQKTARHRGVSGFGLRVEQRPRRPLVTFDQGPG